MCKVCNNSKCTCCKQGPRGPIGPRGPAGPAGADGGVGASNPLVVYKRILSNLNFDNEMGNQSGLTILPFNTNTTYPGLEMLVPEDGSYMAYLEYQPYSTYNIALNTRLVLDGNPVAESVRCTLAVGGNTPPIEAGVYNSTTPLMSLTAGQVLNVEFKTLLTSAGSPSPGNIFLAFATLTLVKVRF